MDPRYPKLSFDPKALRGDPRFEEIAAALAPRS